jgi:hypothetical protein
MDETKPRFRIDPNIRLGDLLIISTMAIGVVSAYVNLKDSVASMSRDLQMTQAVQRDRDAAQDAVMVRIEGGLKDGIAQIRSEQTELRHDVGEISRYVRQRGG